MEAPCIGNILQLTYDEEPFVVIIIGTIARKDLFKDPKTAAKMIVVPGNYDGQIYKILFGDTTFPMMFM